MEMKTIKFKAKDHVLANTSGVQCFPSNTVRYLRIEVDPDNTWLSFDAVDAIFENDVKRVQMAMLNDEGVLSCAVPDDMAARTSRVLVNLVGRNMSGNTLVERLTTYQAHAFNIDANANVAGRAETKVTASMYEQFVGNVETKVKKIEDLTVSAHESETPEVVKTGTVGGPYNLDFGLVRGPQGEQGIQGIQGETGETGNGIASTELNPDYTLTVHYTDGNSDTTESIRGEQGIQGIPGTDGFSPTVDVEAITGGHAITVTDIDGEHEFNVMDGIDGVTDATYAGESVVSNHVAAIPRVNFYAECATTSSANPKEVIAGGFKYVKGVILAIKFSQGCNSLVSIQVGTTYKYVRYKNTIASTSDPVVIEELKLAPAIGLFMYDGTYWTYIGCVYNTATTSVRGLMSASDKTKLNGIKAGAEVNVQSDWDETDSTSDAFIQNKPTIPTVNDATLTIQQNGEDVATFTANSASNVTADIEVPTKISDLEDDIGEVTTEQLEEALTVQTLSDTEPYNYRRTNNGNGAGHREYDEIVGASVGWNQLVQNGDFSDGTNVWNGSNGTLSANDNKLTFTATNVSTYQYIRQGAMSIKQNHVALYFLDITLSEAEKVGLGDGISIMKQITLQANTKTSIAYMTKHTADRSALIVYPARNSGLSVGATAILENVMLFDLTLALGSTIADYVYSLEQSTAGSGVAWLKSHFPKLFDNGYQPYDSGSIKSVEGLSAHEMVGKNLFDKDSATLGVRLDNNGAEVSASDYYTSPFIKVMLGETYIKNSPTADAYHRFARYGADKSFIGASNSNTITIFDASFIKFCGLKSEINNAQLELGSTATDYEPHTEHTYPLDSSVTLRGKYVLDNGQLKAVGDVWKSDGEIDRTWTEIDLGSLNWTLNADTESWQEFRTSSATTAKAVSSNVVPNIVSARFIVTSRSNQNAINTLGITTSNRLNILVAPSSFTDASAFKTAMSGVYIVSEAETPTTETATPYDSPQWCDSHGTEEYIGSELPVGHNTDYPMTLVDTMPSDDGTYEPRVTIANGKRTITWQNV